MAANSGTAAQNRITQPIDGKKLVARSGNVHPLANAQNDRGVAPATLPLQRMLMVLDPGPERKTALARLLREQHDKSSPNYHRWLTPAEFGERFGPSKADVSSVVKWLESNGFKVGTLGAGRTVIEFSGTAAQVRTAFGTEIHKFAVNGKEHWANASDPKIPVALARVVKGVVSLHNFHSEPQIGRKAPARLVRDESGANITLTDGVSNFYGLGPADFGTIYNVQQLWDSGTTGAGQSIAVVGRSNINVQDVRDFRSFFGLPENDPEVIVNGPDPGLDDPNEQFEANLDVQWSGAVARDATIKFVTSASTSSTDGILLSAFYIIDNNLAPVMSVSFGLCEARAGAMYTQFIGQLWEQAAAQGITVLVSSGDNGAAGCDSQSSSFSARRGLGVNALASTPFNVAVGGTDFDQNESNFEDYWNPTSTPDTKLSVKSYIPETTWNESCATGTPGCGPGSVWAGSGGRSNTWAKPEWQSGPGVPDDDYRDLPDVSLFASGGSSSRSAYIVCQDYSWGGYSCANGNVYTVGGTSASAPALAGVMALVNQYQEAHSGISRVGNANYTFYQLAVEEGASCNSSDVAAGANSCIFYDTRKGDISVPCRLGSPDCSEDGFLVDPLNPEIKAWTTTAGYDLATGLGTVNAYNLVTNWSNTNLAETTTTISNLSPDSLTHGQEVTVDVAVSPASGEDIPTGTVTLIATYEDGSAMAVDSAPITNGGVTLTTKSLPGGSYNVTAHYSGDASFAPSDSNQIPVEVEREASKLNIGLVTFDPLTGETLMTGATTAAYGSPYILEVDVTNSAGSFEEPCYLETQPLFTSCPTGSVTLTDNGVPLDAGTYPLSTGYALDETIQLSAGVHNITAVYSGDHSFLPGGGSEPITITPAPTSIASVSAGSGRTAVGALITLSAVVETQSSGVAPTGEMVFYDGSTPIAATVAYQGEGGWFGDAFYPAYLRATITTAFSTAGTRAITARYTGDANYAEVVSPATSLEVTGDAQYGFSLPEAPAGITINAAGESGSTPIAVTSLGGFTGPVQLTCTVNSTVTHAPVCSISPNSVTPTAYGSVVSTLTITTTGAPSGGSAQMGQTIWLGGGVLAFGLLLVPGARRRSRMTMLLLLICVIAVAGFVACGGDGNPPPTPTPSPTPTPTPTPDPGTPAGVYTVTVTGTGVVDSVPTTRTATVTVTVH